MNKCVDALIIKLAFPAQHCLGINRQNFALLDNKKYCSSHVHVIYKSRYVYEQYQSLQQHSHFVRVESIVFQHLGFILGRLKVDTLEGLNPSKGFICTTAMVPQERHTHIL